MRRGAKGKAGVCRGAVSKICEATPCGNVHRLGFLALSSSTLLGDGRRLIKNLLGATTQSQPWFLFC